MHTRINVFSNVSVLSIAAYVNEEYNTRQEDNLSVILSTLAT